MILFEYEAQNYYKENRNVTKHLEIDFLYLMKGIDGDNFCSMKPSELSDLALLPYPFFFSKVYE